MMNRDESAAVILYVDDEDMAGKYFARAFGTDYSVLTASGADAAIDILLGRRVDILVTDYRMPGRDGGDLLRQTARDFPQAVRILVTAFADRDVLLDAVNSGEIFRILEKPLDFDEVRKALRLADELSRERRARHQRLKAIDETLAFLGHELNTPLATIINFARGIARRTSQPEVAKALKAIDDNAGYCLTLLSTFSESIQGAGSVTHEAYSTARQLISSLLDTYPLNPAQRALVRTEILEDFPVMVLPNCVLLVLSSLLGNALRAIKGEPSPMICFTVLVEDSPKIRIVDNGSGISPDILERLMRDPVTTHADEGGKGWGMIFCNRIMQSFGGSIQICSEPGTHTAVTLNFPAIKRNDS